ncbi:hypothetical protein ACWCSD_12455 [Nonomuraea sp. NPDC001684]
MACLRRKSAAELLPHTARFPLLAYGTSLVPQEPAKVFAAGKQAAVPLLQGNTRDEHVEFTLAVYPHGITARQYPAMLTTAFGAAAPRVELLQLLNASLILLVGVLLQRSLPPALPATATTGTQAAR